MPKNLQVRSIPASLHRELKRRAKARGESLTDYVQSILEREVARPMREDVFQRIESRGPVDLGESVAELIRRERREH